jgi:hypothetical protein
LKAFRVYPPEYAPPPNETPNGQIITNEHLRVEMWGNCWNRYYELDVSYFMSSLAQDTLGLLKNKLMWQNTLSASSTTSGLCVFLFVNSICIIKNTDFFLQKPLLFTNFKNHFFKKCLTNWEFLTSKKTKIQQTP